MQRRNFIRIAGGGAVAVAAATVTTAGLAACSAGMPPEAIEAWQGPGRDADPQQDVRRWLLSYAILAPHSHNLQSWVADLGTPNEILLTCDLHRLLPQTDPLSRQIMMSHGTFLELLDLAARVRLSPDATVQKDLLFAQILQRHTNRSIYHKTRPVPAEAWRIELTTPRTVMASYHVLRVGATEIAAHRDGLSLPDPIPVLLDRLGLFDRSKAPAPDDYATTSQIKDFGKKIDSTTGFLWLVTEGNERATQVNAGRAYVRVQLAATAQGLSMQPLSQALQEYAEQARPYREIHALAGASDPGQTVQMWARVGYAPAVEPAPRRRLQEFIRA